MLLILVRQRGFEGLLSQSWVTEGDGRLDSLDALLTVRELLHEDDVVGVRLRWLRQVFRVFLCHL